MTMTIHFCAGGDRNRSVSFGESAWLYYYFTRGGGLIVLWFLQGVFALWFLPPGFW